MPDQASASRWIAVMEDAALGEGEMRAVYPLGVNLVVARVGGQVYAMSGACPHLGCPLFTGSLAGGILTCPCHDWRFDARTGEFLDGRELHLTMFPVKTDGGRLLVGIG